MFTAFDIASPLAVLFCSLHGLLCDHRNRCSVTANYGSKYNKKTARVCILEISHEKPRPRKSWVRYFHSRNTRVPFSVYHMTLIWELWGILSSNRGKCNSEIKDPKFSLDIAMTLRRREQWRNDVTMTLRRQGRWCHFGPSLGAPSIRMTSLRFYDVNHNAAMWYNHVIRKNITRLDCTLDNGKNLVEMFE
jgi:hypothetical protein